MYKTEYRYIAEIAATGSIQKAAENLFVSPSTLSKCVSSLEKKYGVKMFFYDGRHLQCTPPGLLLLTKAQQIIAITEKMTDEMNDLAHYYSGKIRIGMPLYYNSDLTNSVILAFKNQFPFITVNISKKPEFALSQAVLNGELDVAFASPSNEFMNLQTETICTDELVLAVPPKHPLAANAILKEGFSFPWLDFRQLSNERFIVMPPDSPLRSVLQQFSADFSTRVNISIQVTTVREAMQCVAEGLGIAVFYASIQYRWPDGINILSIGKRPIKKDHVVAYRKDYCLDEPIRTFIQLYRDAHHPSNLFPPGF